MSKVLVPRSGPPPNKVSSAETPLFDALVGKRLVMFGRDESREHNKSTFSNSKVVIASAITCSTKFHDSKPSPLGAIKRCQLIEGYDAVCNALQLEVGAFGRSIVKQKNRAFATDKKLLQSQYLATVAQRILSQQTKFGQRIENNARWVYLFDGGQHTFRRLG